MSKRTHKKFLTPQSSLHPNSSTQSVSNQSSTFSNFLTKAIEIAFHLLVIVIPLFFLTVNEELFEFNKMMMTYGFTTVIVTLWIARSIVQKKVLWQRTPFDIPLLLFILSQIASTFLSLHPRTSFFGYYTRFHGGLLSSMTYITLYYAYINNITAHQQTRIFRSLVIGALLVCAYAIPEHFGHSFSCFVIYGKYDAGCWIQDVQTRVFATFGQPNWLAAYAVILIPLTTALFLSAQKTTKDIFSKIDSALYALVTLLLFITLLFTRSRSGFLAIGVGISVFTAGIILTKIFQRSAEYFSPPIPKVGLIVSGFIAIALLFGTPFSPSFSEFSKKLSVTSDSSVEPTASPTAIVNRLDIGGTDSGEIRKIVWQGAIDVWKRYPLFGSGVETFAYSYYTDRPMAHNNVSEWDFLYNKAHNEFLNILATTGVVGLATYLIWQIWVARYFASAVLFSDSPPSTKLLMIGLAAGTLALHISNFFGFSTVTVSILLFVFPAFAVIQNRPAQHTPFLSTTLNPKQYLALGGTAIVGLYALMLILMMWQTDYLYAQAKKNFQEGDLAEAYQGLQKAMQLSPQEGMLYELQSKVASQLAIALVESKDTNTATQIATQAMNASDMSIQLNPYHLNFYKSRVQVLLTLAQAQPDLMQAAIATLDVAEILAPTDPKLEYNEGIIYSSLNDPQKAIEHLAKAVEMKPDYESARYQLGQVYERQQQYSEAQVQYQYILDHITAENSLVKQRLDVVATFSAIKK